MNRHPSLSLPTTTARARALFVVIILCGLAAPAWGATFVVNTNGDDISDENPADGVCESGLGCTLRAAIESANETPGGPHTVEVPYLPGDTYPVWAANSINPYVPMTIRGTGAGRPVIQGAKFLNAALIRAGAAVTIENLEFRPDTEFGSTAYGIEVYRSEGTQIRDVTIVPSEFGEGLRINGGVATCTRCEIKDGLSRGVRLVGSPAHNARLTLLESRVSNNTATGRSGGGVSLEFGQLFLHDSLIDANLAPGDSPSFLGRGGGIHTLPNTTLYVINSTISGNRANHDGGGIYAEGYVIFENATVTANLADDDDDENGTGGGIYIAQLAIVSAKNSIIHGNLLPTSSPTSFPLGRNCDSDLNGAIGFESLGWVQIGNDSKCTIVGIGNPDYTTSLSPALGPLTDLGGPTPVHPIGAVGAEADGGDPSGCTFTLDTGSGLVNWPLLADQRGVSRPLDSDPTFMNSDGNACDVGAYEAKCFDLVNADGDYVGSQCDVCPDVFDPLQKDADSNGIGDACEVATLACAPDALEVIGVDFQADTYDLSSELSIRVEDSMVPSGADVTLTAPGHVFGDGFQVDTGAVLTVVTEAVSCPAP